MKYTVEQIEKALIRQGFKQVFFHPSNINPCYVIGFERPNKTGGTQIVTINSYREGRIGDIDGMCPKKWGQTKLKELNKLALLPHPQEAEKG